MRLMAGFAGEAAGVLIGVHLREALGFGGAGGVTADAEDGGVELRWGDGGIVGVFRQRAVAGFAVDVGVLARGLDGEDVGVTGFTGLVAGEVDRTGGYLADGGAAVVAVLSEGFGHDEVANDEKHRESDDEQSGKSEEMACVFEEAIHRAKCPSGGYWIWYSGCIANS